MPIRSQLRRAYLSDPQSDLVAFNIARSQTT
jgi:hypothetical protein